MLKTIIEKEIRDNITSTRFVVTFAICAVLILLSFYTGAMNHHIAILKYEAAVSQNYRQLEGITDWSAIRDYRIFLPPQPLEALVTGISNDIGRTVAVSGRGELNPEDSMYGSNPVFAVFRFLDLEFIFQVILSLFAILFAYDSINGEKERGTLRLIFSNAVPRDTYILGKLIGAFLSLTIPLLIPVLIGFAIMPLLNISLTGAEWLRLTLIILTGFLYVGAFLTLSVLISSITEKTPNSFLLLLVIWIFSVMIFPRLSVITAGGIAKVPGLDEINSQKSRFISQLWKEDQKDISSYQPPGGMDDMQEVMKGFNKFMQTKADERDKKIKEFSSRLNEDRKNKETVMQKLAFGISRLSPASVFSLAAVELAGTSIDLTTQFNKSISDYQVEYANFMISKTGSNPGGMRIVLRTDDNDEKPKPINPREIPGFKYKPQQTSEIISSSLTDIFILLLFNFVFFGGAFFSFKKFDLR